MQTSFTYLKSGCLYTIQYSFLEVFLLLLLKREKQTNKQAKRKEIVNIAKKPMPKTDTHTKSFLATRYTYQKVQRATEQNSDIATGHNAIPKSHSPPKEG